MARYIYDEFAGPQLNPYWRTLALGAGRVELAGDGLQLRLPAVTGERYADAQITDYAGLPRRWFPWQPPLRLRVRAWAAGGVERLVGTAGFGFWNDPFLPGRAAVPRLPRALWFFYAGPSNNMALAMGQPGNGWKAATFDASGPLFFGLLPWAIPGLLAMRNPALYQTLWPIGQRALRVAEAHLPDDLLLESHEYMIEWLPERVTFTVDGSLVLVTNHSPRGPLGFIAWIDNQYAVVTPQGQFAWGLAAGAAQTLTLAYISIEQTCLTQA